MNPVVLTFLGASGPYGGSDDLPSVLVSWGKKHILVDAGEGVQHRLHEVGRSVSSLTHVLISHLHGDHVLGLIPLLQSRSLAGSEDELIVVGPPGITNYLRESFRFLHFSPSFPLRIAEVEEGELDLGSFTVRVGKGIHSVTVLAFRIALGPVSICYVTDTRPFPEEVGLCEGVDVLIHDAAFHSRDRELAEEYLHSTAREAAEVADACGTGMLILYHRSPRYKDVGVLLEDAKSVFRNSVVASRYMKIYLRK